MEDRILRIVHAELSRRSLMKGVLGAAALAAAPISGLAFTEVQALAANLPDDFAILNFALTLEHLEDVAYRQAIASGKLTGKNQQYAQLFGDQEHQHVVLITGALQQAGKMPVAEQAHYNFPAYTDEHTIVDFLRVLEEVGVGAYSGAAQYIKDKGILTVAGGIQQVEARHTAILRRQDGMAPVPSAFEKALTPDMVLAAAGPILGA
ncbi:MAG: ferritin-like domain-containing protein [Thermomicrobia bacterium]|nr:ferritin-like domain-containing protein [Thermomicrobia bacterium]MCA1724793.1 ferritin-like domain-containing protein [Thermomicrobia bacterium]